MLTRAPKMTFAPSNPHGISVGMDISVGALKTDEEKKETKKSTMMKYGEGLDLGATEFFHGIIPQWKILEEKYFEKMEKKQEKYRERLKVIKRRRIESSANKFKDAHNRLLCLVGPEWYQELSPKQKELIDTLQTAMKKDLDKHFTKATRSSLSLLGITPLPNDSQLWRALTKSFGCPVEFLLLLYQLIKPKGNVYSINDRLLLSGVAHLTLRDTLREMHVRSPSPPRVVKKPPAPEPKQKAKKYDSVYLEPFTFEWPYLKSDRYKNQLIQRPRCPYFSYICEYEPVRVRRCDDVYRDDRVDEHVQIPCELHQDHIVAEEYYNSLFRPAETTRYIILRPKMYERSTPITYPGILPKYMIPKQYPPPIKLTIDVKIYDEINMENQKSRKVMRTTCEVRMKPWGRPGQSSAQKLIAKYVYIKNIGNYLRKNSDIYENERGGYPCSTCGGPEAKQILPEIKPIKVKSWIKRPRSDKKIREIVYTDLSNYMETGTTKIDMDKIDEDTKKLIKENKDYVDKWKALFDNIARMENLRIEAETCACPGKTKEASKFDADMDCTCAVWNLVPPPRPIPPKMSCECDPKLNAEEKTAGKGVCDSTKVLDACGNCVKQTPMKFSLVEEEKKKECECIAKPPEGGKKVTVAYVFLDNKLKVQSIDDGDKGKDGCRLSKYNFDKKRCPCKEKKEAKKKKNENRKKDTIKKEKTEKSAEEPIDDGKNMLEKNGAASTRKTNEIVKGQIKDKSDEKQMKCLVDSGKISELDHCRRETEKLLNLLKCSCTKCKDLRKKYRAKFIRVGTRVGCGGAMPVIGGVFGEFGEETECDCLEKFEIRVKGVKDYKERLRAKLDLKSQKDRYVIGGVHKTPAGPVFNLTSVMPKNHCICRTSEEILKETRKDENLVKNLKPGFKHLISGVRGDPDSPEYIIGGLTKECQCSEVYKKFMKEHNECLVNYEKYLKYMEREIQAYMEDINERYKDPPLTAQKLVENELKKMTGAPGLPLPDGKSEFLISGVQAKELGKSFILGGMLRNRKDNDECTIAVESYTHIPEIKGNMSKCERNFLCHYMTFGRNCVNPFNQHREVAINESMEETVCRCISYESISTKEASEREKDVLNECACDIPCGNGEETSDDCSCPVDKVESEESCVCPELKEDEKEIETPEGCTCGSVESVSSASDPCLCGVKNCGCQAEEVCVKECFYGPMEAWWSEEEMNEVEKKKEEEKAKAGKSKYEESSGDYISSYGGPSKRFIVLRQIPTKRREQIVFLEKLLKGLADDGYPLAQLPDCHRLPHFRLWFQFRMRNYDDGVKNLKTFQALWNHIAVCRRKVPYPKLPLYCVCEAGNLTWREAGRVSKMVAETKKKYYEKVRENMVDYAREFYATLSPYQFPNASYFNRNFFAYQPDKVDNVIAQYIWEYHEHKNKDHYKSCLC